MSNGKKLRTATVGPTSQALVRGPGLARTTRSGAVYRVDVFPGTHTSVTFRDVGTSKIESNNPNVSDTRDTAVWLDPGASGNERTIHFYVRFTRDRKPDTTLFLLEGGGSGGARAIFQVRRVPLPERNSRDKGRIFATLNGLSISLNQDDGKIEPYNLVKNFQIPNSMPHGDALDKALDAANGQIIDHLVINAHGGAGTGSGEIELGDHFHMGNLDSWNRLRNRVRYIWMQNCVIGNFNDLMNSIAERTGAWVAAPFESLESTKERFKTIDLVAGAYKYFNTEVPRDATDSAVPRPLDLFYKTARMAARPNLDPDVAFLLSSPRS